MLKEREFFYTQTEDNIASQRVDWIVEKHSPENIANILRGLLRDGLTEGGEGLLSKDGIRLNIKGRQVTESIFKSIGEEPFLKEAVSLIREDAYLLAEEIKTQIEKAVQKEALLAGRKIGRKELNVMVEEKIKEDKRMKKVQAVRRMLTSITRKAEFSLKEREWREVKAEIKEEDLDVLRRQLLLEKKKVPSRALLENMVVMKKLNFKEDRLLKRDREVQQDNGLQKESYIQRLHHLPFPFPSLRATLAAVGFAGALSLLFFNTVSAPVDAVSSLPVKGDPVEPVVQVIPKPTPPEAFTVSSADILNREVKKEPEVKEESPPLVDNSSLVEDSKSFFVREVEKMARELDPENKNMRLAEHLLAVMEFESGLSATRENVYSRATGLIQFLPETAVGLGTTIEDLKKLTAVEQLQYVKKYLLPYKGRLNSLNDVYMAVLYPVAISEDEDYIIFTSGTVEYRQNAYLDGEDKGYVTVADAVGAVKATAAQNGLDSIS